MIVGFNHNVTYRGVCFHVQTEDSGIKSPHLITLLYHGGTIISSHKTSYADILNVDNLETVVEELAKDQHKGMLRKLKNGEFDQRIVEFGIGIKPPEATEAVTDEPVREAQQQEPAIPFEASAAVAMQPSDEQKPASLVEGVDDRGNQVSTDLDDLIFSYLSGEDGNQ